MRGIDPSGKGARVETSLLEAGIAAMVFHAQQYLSLGQVPQPQGNHHPVIAPYGAFKAADGLITIAVGTQRHWEAFCKLIGRPKLVDREDFHVGPLRKDHYRELAAEIGIDEDRIRRLRESGALPDPTPGTAHERRGAQVRTVPEADAAVQRGDQSGSK